MGIKFKTFFSITVVILITIVLHYMGWLSPIENLVRKAVSPASGLIYSWSVQIGGEDESFDSVEKLEKAYQQLRSTSIQQQIDRAELELLESENMELRELLEFHQTHDYRYEVAEVIGKNIDPLGSTVLIGKGEEQGLSVGNAVIVGNGILVGTVASTVRNSAVVRLINDNQSRIAATILNKERSMGLVEGGFGISVQMNFIPQNEEIDIDEVIVTSGLIAKIPRGLLIGRVDAIEREAYQPFQKAILTPVANLEKLTIVSVIVSS